MHARREGVRLDWSEAGARAQSLARLAARTSTRQDAAHPPTRTAAAARAQDTEGFYKNPPPAIGTFKPADLEGAWYKVLGYNPNYDTYPCQKNTFTARADGGLDNEILFRVPKPDGSGSWQVPPLPRASEAARGARRPPAVGPTAF
jgi:hypothetical protein